MDGGHEGSTQSGIKQSTAGQTNARETAMRVALRVAAADQGLGCVQALPIHSSGLWAHARNETAITTNQRMRVGQSHSKRKGEGSSPGKRCWALSNRTSDGSSQIGTQQHCMPLWQFT